MGIGKLEDIVSNKKVLFVTTKNIDYIRNTQEVRLLKENAKTVDIIYSDSRRYVVRILSVWKQLNKKMIDSVDVIFIGFAPQLIIPFIGFKMTGKTIVIDFFISVYDTLICDRKKFKTGGLIAQLSHKIDEKTIDRADHIITDTKAHAQFFREEFGGEINKYETIYLEADRNIYYPRKQNKPSELNNKFVVLYFGSILPLQGVDIVLDAISLLKYEDTIFFEIIGPIPKQYNKPIQDNVKYIDWLSQEELAEHIANADLCLAGHFNANIEKAKRTIPGKAYIYEMMEKKMVLGNSIANRELFCDDSQHYFVEMGNTTKLIELLKEVTNV